MFPICPFSDEDEPFPAFLPIEILLSIFANAPSPIAIEPDFFAPSLLTLLPSDVLSDSTLTYLIFCVLSAIISCFKVSISCFNCSISESAAKLFVENNRREENVKAGRQIMCQKLVSYNVLILIFPSLIQIRLGTFANQRSTILYK